jgi:hypothetical protein
MNRAKILSQRGSKDDISAENLTLSQPNLALSESSRRNKLSQVTGAAGLNLSVQYSAPTVAFYNNLYRLDMLVELHVFKCYIQILGSIL